MQSTQQGQKEEVRKVQKLLLLFGYAFKDNVFSFSLMGKESTQQRQQAYMLVSSLTDWQ